MLDPLSKDAIVWAYRLFLDRDPENEDVIQEKQNYLSDTQSVRHEFLSCEEYQQNSKNLHYADSQAILRTLDQDAVQWAYRFFLDRVPENESVVQDKLQRLFNTYQLRKEFLSSIEYILRNQNPPYLSMSGNEPDLEIDSKADLPALFFHIQGVWESLGQTEPHWSVLMHKKFSAAHIEQHRESFYHSGKANVATLFKTLARNGIAYQHLKTCLEYGCGVGRVTAHLAEKFESVWAYDISRSHLKLAQQYLAEPSLNHVSLIHLQTPADLEQFPRVDLVYSIIVLQHNPPPLIALLIRKFIQALLPGGVAFFQVLTYRRGYSFDLDNYLKESMRQSQIEMHVLPQKDIFEIIDQEGARLIEVLEDSWAGLKAGQRSNTFLVQKKE